MCDVFMVLGHSIPIEARVKYYSVAHSSGIVEQPNE